jgi:hypothetical protein
MIDPHTHHDFLPSSSSTVATWPLHCPPRPRVNESWRRRLCRSRKTRR